LNKGANVGWQIAAQPCAAVCPQPAEADLHPRRIRLIEITGAHVLIAQLGSQPATAAEISRVIGRPRDVVTQRLDELIERGYVEHRGNRYEITTKLNVPNLQRHMRSNINIIRAAAKRLGAAHP